MASFLQHERRLQITSPLGEDAVLITGLSGVDQISHLYAFELDLVADENGLVPFDEILGRNVTVSLRDADGTIRYWNGMVRRFEQAGHEVSGDTGSFVRYRAEIVPDVWLLTKRVGSRIFQHLSTPAILERVLSGFDVEFDLSSKYPVRNFCIQYRESDFAFISRLMEDEGIWYYFRHDAGRNRMVVTDGKAPLIEGNAVIPYQRTEGTQPYTRGVHHWAKRQELRAAEYSVRDYCFQLPTRDLSSKQRTLESLKIGRAQHKVRDASSRTTEIYEYPGGYGQRFDAVTNTGQYQPQELKQIFEEEQRVALLRMEEEEAASIEIRGDSNCMAFTAGHRFILTRHFDGDDEYLITRVEHVVRQAGHRARGDHGFEYSNSFACVPKELRFRPQRKTPKPVISGVQTAVVTAHSGEELTIDRYGRVKVHFHWDREGKMDASSSCWVRVSQLWAGRGWGAFFWPRVGHEVVVAFEEGDPDRPIIIGSVYNAQNMPWFDLPVNKHLAGFKSASFGGTMHKNFNGVVFNDTAGNEHVAIHSERNLALNSEGDKFVQAGTHKGERVALANMTTVGKLLPG